MKSVEEFVKAAVTAIIRHDTANAFEILKELTSQFGQLESERAEARIKVWGPNSSIEKPLLLPQKARRIPVRKPDEIATFSRDRFTCRYVHCQRRTIYIPVLKEISRIMPNSLPYQSNWRPVQSHILYWTWSTSLEHKISFPYGGDSEPENLITSCYQCNDLKNYLPFETLGWEISEPSASEWDGLIGYLPSLKEIKSNRTNSMISIDKPRIVTSSLGSLDAIEPGCLVRAKLPGKKQVRSYRVDRLTDSEVTLTEMWCRSSDGAWVASEKQKTLPVASLQQVSIRTRVAPSEGSHGSLE